MTPEHESLPGRSAAFNSILAFILSRAVFAAAQLDLADLLIEGALEVDELAERAGVASQPLTRLLRVLTDAGIFRWTADGAVALNEAAAFLRADADGSLRALALFYGRAADREWPQFMHSLRTGESAHRLATGMTYWEFLSSDPEEAAIFNAAMAGASIPRAERLRTYPWPVDATVVDVGGGDGAVLVDVLSHQPGLRGVVVDMPDAVALASQRIALAGLTSRCRAVVGDLFGELPDDGDIYLLCIVLHDWPDDAARAILRNFRSAMCSGAKLLILERILPPEGPAGVTALVDLHMLVELGGRERTLADWDALLGAAGFARDRVYEGEWSLIEASPL